MLFTRAFNVFFCFVLVSLYLASTTRAAYYCRGNQSDPPLDIGPIHTGAKMLQDNGHQWQRFELEGYEFLMRGDEWKTPQHCFHACSGCIKWSVYVGNARMQCYKRVFRAECWLQWGPSGEDLMSEEF